MRFPVSPEKQKDLENRMMRLGIREPDLVEDFIRGAGPGGQKVNKTSVAVVLRYAPSQGIRVEIRCQESRSQALNRFLARRLLCDKLEGQILGQASAQQKAIEKIRRQKRRRSRRAKEKMLRAKHHRSGLKENRRKPSTFQSQMD